MKDVACVLVNFNSGRLCASAVRSLLAQRFEGRQGGQGSLQLIVVDNASPLDQHQDLDPLRDLGVQVIYHDENEGYGRGMNLGMNHVDAEFVLLANPDILVLEGAIQALLDALRRDPRAGAAGARGYLDGAHFITLPPNDLPTLRMHVLESLGRVHRRVAKPLAHARTRRFLRAWSATEPQSMAMISGFAMFFRTALARRLGPFDPHFAFYFEDADLCRRVRRAGYRLALVPRARMIHFFDQSARQVRAEVTRKYEQSRTYYYRKHYGDRGLRLFERMGRYAANRADRTQGWRFYEPEDLGELGVEPLALQLPRAGPWLMEIATDPVFLFCGGHLGDGAECRFPVPTWRALEAIRWYVRVLDARDLSLLRYVTFQKSTHSTGPVSFEEYLQLHAGAPA